ncbi:unnamed protein product, partial [Tetraodon nigroviridis]
EQLSSQVEQLRSRLTESQQSLQSTTAELQQLQTEHDTLLERHNKILQEAISKEAELRERVLSLQSENVTLQADLSETQADLSTRVESQRQTYREQLRKLQDDHRTTVETLQTQLTRVEEQLFNLQSQNNSQRRSADQSQAGLGLVALSDLQSTAREEGEGMETTETESPSPAGTPLTSLEHLLMSPDPKQEPFVWNVEPSKEELTQKLNTATRSMEHMNSLLHETEATNAVLMEQITDHPADRAPAEQDPESHDARPDRQAARRESVPPGVRPEVHPQRPPPGHGCRGGGGVGGPLPTHVSKAIESKMCQVCPEEELSTTEEGEEPEEARPVVLEQGDVSGRLRGGAEAAAGHQLAGSGVETAFGGGAAATQTCSPYKLFNHLQHGGLGWFRYRGPAKAMFLSVYLLTLLDLLKSELRRLERNQEREKSVANLEYLKNVLLQFIFLRSGSERQALLPVIHTMLQLSPEEKSKLAAIAQGTYWLKAI